MEGKLRDRHHMRRCPCCFTSYTFEGHACKRRICEYSCTMKRARWYVMAQVEPRLEKIKRERAWKEKKKKKVRVTIEGRVQQPVCKLTHFYICLIHNTRGYTLRNLATGGTVKSENVQYGIATADNLLRAFLYFCIFVSLYL